jgi:hypothetical protein
MADPITKDEMRTLLQDQAKMLGGIINKSNSKEGSSSYSAPYSGSYDPYTSSGNLFKDTVSGTIGILGKLGSGTYNVSDALNTATGIIGKFGTVGEIAAQVIGQVGEGANNVNNALNETSRYGVTFGRNIAGFNEEILRANLTVPEFVSIIQQSSRQIVGLGGGASASGKAFLNLLEEFNNTDYGKKLKEAGMAPKELADAMLINAGVMTRANTIDANAKYQAQLATGKLAEEMNKVADLTGKSRKQQEAELQAIAQRADVQSEIFQRMTVDRNFGLNLERAADGLSVYGTRAQQAIAEASTEIGIHTPEMINFIASMGPAGDEITRYGDAIKSGNLAEIERQKKVTEEAIARQMSTKEYQSLMSYQQGSILGVGKDFEQSAKYLQAIRGEQIDLAKKQSEKTGQIVDYQDISIAQARDSLIEQGRLSREGKIKDEKTGEEKEDPKAVLSKILNDLNGVGKAASVETAKMFSGLNDKLSATVSTEFPKFTEGLRNLTNPKFMENMIKTEFNKSMDDVLNKLKIPVAERVPGARERAVEAPKKDVGSPGTVGSLVENFGQGTLIETHGREGVLTEQQQLNLVRGSIDTGAKDAFSNVQRTLTAMISAVKPESKPQDTVKIDSDVLSEKINSIKVPDLTQPLNRIIEQFGNIAPPDLSKVQTQLDTQASNIKFPDLSIIQTQLDTQASNIKFPDFGLLFTDLTSRMSQIKLPDFAGPLNELGKQIGNYEIPDPVEPNSDGVRDLTNRMETIFKKLAGDFDATIKGPQALNEYIDRSAINSEELNERLTQIKAPDFSNIPIFKEILNGFTADRTERETRIEPVPQPKETTERSRFIESDASLKDVVNGLDQLNKSIMQMVGHTEKLTDYGSKQIRATQSLSNNRFA